MSYQVTSADPDLFSSLKQIFPNHKEVVIQRVIADQSAGGSMDSIRAKCIGVLVDISPSSDWNDDKKRYASNGQLTSLQSKVLEDLQRMFPEVDKKVINVSVRHPSNTYQPLSEVTLLERCIDDLLHERTFLEAWFSSDDDDDSSAEEKSQRMISSTVKEKLDFASKTEQLTPEASVPTETINGVITAEDHPRAKIDEAQQDLSKYPAKSIQNIQTFAPESCHSAGPITTGSSSSGLHQARFSRKEFSDSDSEEAVPLSTQDIQTVAPESCNSVGPITTGSSSSGLQQTRFSCVEFSDSDSEEAVPLSVKEDLNNSDDDLPTITFRAREKVQTPLSKVVSPSCATKKQYVSASKFTSSPSNSSKSIPVIRNIFSTLQSPNTISSAVCSSSGTYVPGVSYVTGVSSNYPAQVNTDDIVEKKTALSFSSGNSLHGQHMPSSSNCRLVTEMDTTEEIDTREKTKSAMGSLHCNTSIQSLPLNNPVARGADSVFSPIRWTSVSATSSTEVTPASTTKSLFSPVLLPELGQATVTGASSSQGNGKTPLSTASWGMPQPGASTTIRPTIPPNTQCSAGQATTSFLSRPAVFTVVSTSMTPLLNRPKNIISESKFTSPSVAASNSTAESSAGFQFGCNKFGLFQKPFTFFSNKNQPTKDTPEEIGFRNWFGGGTQDPIVIKDVTQSCKQSTATTGAHITLQNTIPLQLPNKDKTTVTIESVHQITYQGKASARPADRPSTPGERIQGMDAPGPKTNPDQTGRQPTPENVIILADDSSNDSVLSLDDVLYDGSFHLPQPPDGMEGLQVGFDTTGAQVGFFNPPMPFDYPYFPQRRKRRKSKKKKRKKSGMSSPPIVSVPAPDNDVHYITPGPEAVVDINDPMAEWNLQEDLKKNVLELFPDVDPAHVDQLCLYHKGPLALNNICNVLLESNYPKKQVAKPPPPTATVTKPTETPVDYFKDYKSVIIPPKSAALYEHQTYTLLSNEFNWISGRDIRRVMAVFGNYYAPAYQELALVWKQAKEEVNKDKATANGVLKYAGLAFDTEIEADHCKKKFQIKLLKNKRQPVQLKKSIVPELQTEVDFVVTRLKEIAKEADHEVAMRLNEQEYEEEGQCIECGCCYVEHPFENMVQCFEGHLFCQDCLRQYAKEAVYGQGKVDMKCMTDMCDSSFPKSQLVKALPSEVLAKYEDRQQEENINLADLEDLVRCPHCDFAALMDPFDKVFGCYQCGKETCRHCKEDWSEHFGKRCEELEKKDETKLRLTYEERMTQAKIRTCHKCKAQFTKEDGCNKMTCRCGAKMCYICRTPNINYNHFCQHVREPGHGCTICKACSLWTNPEDDDNRAVKEIQKEALETRKQQGFMEEKLIGAPDEPPAKKAKLTF